MWIFTPLEMWIEMILSPLLWEKSKRGSSWWTWKSYNKRGSSWWLNNWWPFKIVNNPWSKTKKESLYIRQAKESMRFTWRAKNIKWWLLTNKMKDPRKVK